MKVLWCWRCRIDVPMLDEEEFKKAQELYSLGFKNLKSDRFKPLLNYYNKLTGFGETEPNAIMHHRIDLYALFVKIVKNPIELHQLCFVLLVITKEVNTA